MVVKGIIFNSLLVITSLCLVQVVLSKETVAKQCTLDETIEIMKGWSFNEGSEGNELFNYLKDCSGQFIGEFVQNSERLIEKAVDDFAKENLPQIVQ